MSDLHRIDEQFAIADFRKHGLQWEAAIPALRASITSRAPTMPVYLPLPGR